MATTFHRIEKDLHSQESFFENYTHAMREWLTVQQKQLLGILDHNSEEYQSMISQNGTIEDIQNMLAIPNLHLSEKCFEPILAVVYSQNNAKLWNLFVDALLALHKQWKISIWSSFTLANQIRFLPLDSMKYFLEKVKEHRIDLITYFKATIADLWSQYADLIFSYYDQWPIISAMHSYNEKVARKHGVPWYSSVE